MSEKQEKFTDREMTLEEMMDVKYPSQPQSAGRASRFLSVPSTKTGRWAAILGLLFVVFFLINSFVFMSNIIDIPFRETILPFYGILLLGTGLVAGILSLFALLRLRERSILLYLCLLPGFCVLFLVLGEILGPHYAWLYEE